MFTDENYLLGSDALCADVLGFIDIGSEQRKMNDLRPVTVEIAKTLVRYGQEIIADAISSANQPWYKADLPGATSRKNVQDHLQWHANNLSSYTSPTAIYPNGDDAKLWTMRAYIESNAVAEGGAATQQAWAAMWVEINAGLKKIGKAAGSAARALVEGVTGVPIWALAVGGVTLTVLLGVLAFKVMNSSVGQQIIVRRLGGR
jgi:hypothetical protein